MPIEARLARLEKATAESRAAIAERQERVAEEHAKKEAAWAIMQQTMSDEHARLVVEAYAAGAHDYGSPRSNSPAGRLLRRCLDAFSRLEYLNWPYSDIPAEVAVAMPPEVANVYLTDAGALPLHECEDCGYHLPHGYFKGCPLCGGRIGHARK